MRTRILDPRLVARPLLSGAALLAVGGLVAASTHEGPAAPLSMATEGPALHGAPDPGGAAQVVDIPPRDADEATPRGDATASTEPRRTLSHSTPPGTAPRTSVPGGSTSTTRPGAGALVVDESTLGALVGTVTDDRGNPIPDICIVSVDPVTGPEVNGVTDADGHYRAEGVRADQVVLQMCHPERTPFGWLTSVIGPGWDLTDGRDSHGDTSMIELGALRGRAVDADGAPLAGRCVILHDVDSPNLVGDDRIFGTAVTDQDGRFTVPNLMPGWLPLTVATCGPQPRVLLGPTPVHLLSGQWTDAVVSPSSPGIDDYGNGSS